MSEKSSLFRNCNKIFITSSRLKLDKKSMVSRDELKSILMQVMSDQKLPSDYESSQDGDVMLGPKTRSSPSMIPKQNKKLKTVSVVSEPTILMKRGGGDFDLSSTSSEKSTKFQLSVENSNEKNLMCSVGTNYSTKNLGKKSFIKLAKNSNNLS